MLMGENGCFGLLWLYSRLFPISIHKELKCLLYALLLELAQHKAVGYTHFMFSGTSAVAILWIHRVTVPEEQRALVVFWDMNDTSRFTQLDNKEHESGRWAMGEIRQGIVGPLQAVVSIDTTI